MLYPKIMIVTSLDVFEDNSSSSLTIQSIFGGIPRSNIYQLICSNLNDYKRGYYGDNKYYLNRKDILLCPTRKQKKQSSLIIQPIDKRIANKGFNLKYEIITFAKDIVSVLPYKINNDLISFIINEGIQIFYTCSFNPRCYYLINSLSKKTGIRHICHFLDDWPNIVYIDSWGSRFIRSNFNKFLANFIKESPFSLCISELMCEEYAKRYEYDRFFPLMHSVDAIEIGEPCEQRKKNIIYAGSLYLERYLSILEFCKCIDKSFYRNSINIVIYTHKAQWDELSHYYKDFSFIEYGGFVAHEELMTIIKNSYALLFVESIKEEMLEYTRLSMSTKIPEFLSSGKPIFAIGNENQGSIAYLKKHNAAFVVNDFSMIDQSFQDLFDSRKTKIIIGNAIRLFFKNHIKSKQQTFFLSLLNKVL